METNHSFIVVTGGPGSGKSTLIEALQKHGIGHMPEAGRAIIQDQVSIGGQALPWDNRAAFADLMLAWEMRSYREAKLRPGPVLFDRGIPDVVGYLELCELPVPTPIATAASAYKYNRHVFITPAWPEIYAQDQERKQSIEEAEATHEAMVKAYSNHGYELVPVPRAPIAERVRFVLHALQDMKVGSVGL